MLLFINYKEKHKMLFRKWVALPLVFCSVFTQSVFAAENEATTKDAEPGIKSEDIYSWYLTYGVDTVGFPVSPVNRISFGFVIANKFDVGFVVGRGQVSDLVKDVGSFKDSVDKLSNVQDIPNLIDPDTGRPQLPAQAEEREAVFEAIPVEVSGLEFRFPVGGRRFDMPIRLKQLSFDVNRRSTDTLNGIFSLKDEYKNADANIVDVIDGERILLFSIGFGNKFRSKWGGTIAAEWLTLEYSISQPKEIEPIFSVGMFSFEFGIRR